MSSHHEIESEKAPPGVVHPEEVKALIRRLAPSDPEFHEPAHLEDDSVTIAAICEATGAHEQEVLDALEAIRERSIREHVSKTLRELEEPTYRVERAPPKPGESTTRSALDHMKSVDRILEALPQRQKRSKATTRTVEPTAHDKAAQWSGTIILFGLIFFITLIAILGVTGVIFR